jgi:hypothetical protein
VDRGTFFVWSALHSIITLLPFFIEMLQYDWLWSDHMIIKEMFYIPIKLKPELARASMTTSDVNNQWRHVSVHSYKRYKYKNNISHFLINSYKYQWLESLQSNTNNQKYSYIKTNFNFDSNCKIRTYIYLRNCMICRMYNETFVNSNTILLLVLNDAVRWHVRTRKWDDCNIITLLPFFIEMLQYDWLWSDHMIIKEMFYIHGYIT